MNSEGNTNLSFDAHFCVIEVIKYVHGAIFYACTYTYANYYFCCFPAKPDTASNRQHHDEDIQYINDH